jgi:penicillin-binding protein 2
MQSCSVSGTASSYSRQWWRAVLADCLRLAYLQVWRHEDLLAQAESNRTAIVPIVPNRGLILDRNGVVLASNYSAYTLEITPSKTADLEQTIEALSKVVDISARDRRRFKELMDESRSFESLPDPQPVD